MLPSRQWLWAIVFLGLVSPRSAPAQSPMMGVGVRTCIEFLGEYVRSTERQMYLSWFGGFASGVNAMLTASNQSPKDLSFGTADALLEELVEECRRRPAIRFIDASLEVWGRQRFTLGEREPAARGHR